MKIRRLTALLLAICLVLAYLPAGVRADELTDGSTAAEAGTGDTVASGTCGENLTWTLSGDGTLTISGEGAMDDYKSITTPWKDIRKDVLSVVVEPGVTEIGNYAFVACSNLVKATISDTVVSIGSSAFSGCENLSEIDLPDSVTEIGSYAFNGCESLTQLTIPAGVSSLGDSTFVASGLVSIVIPEGVTAMGNSNFEDCSALTAVSLPASLTDLGEQNFYHCTALEKITVAEGNTAFSSDESGVLYNADMTTIIAAPGAMEGSFVIPDTVTALGDDAFAYCTGLTEVTIPASTVNYGYGVFAYCSSLNNVVLPEGATAVGEDMFYYNTSLSDVTIPASVTEIKNGAFLGCSALRQIAMPEGLTTLGSAAFSYSGLTSVKIPDGVTVIEIQTFYGCPNLKDVELPANLLELGDWAFQESNLLENIVLPEGMQIIGNTAFSGCESLESITIPASVTEIGSGAFNMTGLTEIRFEGGAPTFVLALGYDSPVIFDDVTATAYYPAGNETWTEEVMQDYGGTITWVAYETEEEEAASFKVENMQKGQYYIDDLVLGDDGVYRTPDGEKCYIAIRQPLNSWLGGGTLAEYVETYGETYFDMTDWEALTALEDEDGFVLLTEESLGYLVTTITGNAAWGETEEHAAYYLYYETMHYVTGLEITKAPDRTEFVEGLVTYDLTGLEMTVTWADGEVSEYSFEENLYYIDGFELKGMGIQEGDGTAVVYIGCCDVVVSYTLNTIENPMASIEIYNADELPALIENGYIQGGENYLDHVITRKIQFLVTYTDGETEVIGADAQIAGYGVNVTNELEGPDGENTITYELLAHTVTYNPVFVQSDVASIELVSGPNPLVYGEDHRVDLTGDGYLALRHDWSEFYDGLVFQINYTDGTSVQISAADLIYSDSDMRFLDLPEYDGYPVEAMPYMADFGDGFYYWVGGAFTGDGKGNVPMRLHYKGCYLDFTLMLISETASGTCGENLTWTLSGDGTLTISGEGEMDDSEFGWADYADQITKVVISEGVTSIGSAAFSGCANLTEVSLPSTLTTIGGEAFMGTGLTSVTIPGSVSSMGYDVFCECTALKSVVLGEGITEISTSMFYGCTSLETVEIPGSVTIIGPSAFKNCTALNNVVLSEGLEEIHMEAFAGCTSLTSITIPSSVSLFLVPFRYCTGLETITFLGDKPESLEADSTAFADLTITIRYPADNDTWTEEVMQDYGGTITWVSYTQEEADFNFEVTLSIGDLAGFSNTGYGENSNVRNTITGTGTHSIRYDGASYYVGYLYVDILGTQGYMANYGVDFVLTDLHLYVDGVEIPVDLDAVLTGSYGTPGDWRIVLANLDDGFSALEQSPKEIGEIDEYLEVVFTIDTVKAPTNQCGDNAYWEISDGTLIISGEGAMYDNDDDYTSPWIDYKDEIKKIVVDDGITHVGIAAFNGLTNVTEATLADTVISIGASAFTNCTALTEITLSKNLTTIGDFAFGSAALTEIVIPGTVTEMGESVFWECTGLKNVVVEDGAVTVGIYTFDGCTALESVVIPDSVTQIGSNVFHACSSLTSVELGNGITSIGLSAFNGCTSLTQITLPASLTYINHGAFTSSGLTEITFLGNAPAMESDVFTNLTVTAYYPAGDETWTEEVKQNYGGTITWTAVCDAHDYESVVTEPTCTEQGYTTYTCTKCGDSYVTGWVDAYGHSYVDDVCERCGEVNVTTVASGYTGANTWKLTNDGVLYVSGSGNMKNYGYEGTQPWAEYADQIVKVVIEEGVTAVGSGAFMNMTKLTTVELPESSLTKIGEAAFYGCTSLESIYIPDSVYTIWAYTFKGCTSLTSVRLSANLIKIDQGAFENCTALTYVFIPGYTNIIGAYSFKGCTSLKTVDMRWADATEIRMCAFKNCSSLKTVYLPADIQVLGDSAFYGIGAAKFTVPDTVTSVGAWCFARSSLTEITFEGDAPAIGEGAFNKITATVYYNAEYVETWQHVTEGFGGTITYVAK